LFCWSFLQELIAARQYCLYTSISFATAFLSSLPTCSGISIACTPHNFVTTFCVISFNLFWNQRCLYTLYNFATALCIISFNLFRSHYCLYTS
jgi:hypothetical protein